MKQLAEISWQGLWKNNPAMVQLLGLCPLLAVSSTVINGLGLGIATTLVLLGSNVTVSLVRQWIPKEIRIPVFVMIIAAFVTAIQLLMNAYTYDLYLALGIFIPLIVTNCAIIGRAEAFASKNPVVPAAVDGFMMGLGFTLVLVTIGAIRELLGQGTLLSGSDSLFGPVATSWTIELFAYDNEFLIALLPPGAFLVMGFIIALKNIIDSAAQERAKKSQPAAKIERVRVSGAAE
ncbi:electron transport complex subunit E [Neiella sp. HB171785]|uniref:Ion-translocating oxidoreductase complex subunit E n=1 Tax=Neiella litorisoli TaxID=2771431 RepID=A0A8J6UFE6_9GAMM|nr:electron transport complex subunit E [Neiella litorisoli]MBD1390959.1 electron transport complex subunit E [Neiella litorisoli]